MGLMATLGKTGGRRWAGRFLGQRTFSSGEGGDTVGLSMDLVADGDHFLEIRAASDGAVVATGVIPPGDGLGGSTEMAQSLNFVSATSASATATVRFGPRSAILTIEADGLHPLSRYTAHLHGGTPSAPSASVGHLGSADTDASGHLVLRATRVMTATNASGDLSPDLLFDGAHFVDLHGPDGWPAAEHLIDFKPRPDSFVSGLALYIAHDRIVAAQAGCNTPEQLVRDADGELPLIWRPR